MNLLSVFPNVFPGEEGTSSLQVLELNSNELSKVPDELIQLADHLRTLDLSQNWLTELPFPIAYLSKLKQLSLAVNSFKDKRFYKIANDKRSKPSTIIEYLKKKCPSKPTIDKSGKKAAAAADSVVSANVNHPQIIIHFGHNSFSVKRESEVVRLRPYLICCLLKNVLLDEDKLKNTLVIQNKLHDSICQKRVAASIALHDASKIKPPLLYTALEPEALILTPLHRHTAITGKQFVQALTTEAELMRKQQKRNMYSPLHKYLHLVEKMDLYPCTVDSTGLVISFAPVTNSELTKMTTETNDIFIEVSSGESQTLCREIMDELVRSLFVGGISSPLTVEQIKVVQHGGNLLTAYPDKNDLQLEGISVRRELKEETKASESSTAEDV
ncbi:hypothetical protein AB6A40_002661 [Gnathostoma spinigerum]|uniref:B3/B4 tRNA-binding domain-containing protein n=1 Tax=Gnathostoma spinigerum TaxID=75299 RepID=A0ABD6EHB7_9BILA